MRSDTILACAMLGVVTIMVTGCSQDPPPPFVDSTGEAKSEIEYAAGPYGVGVGSTITDYAFIGYADAKATAATMQLLSLGDFYNPHAFDSTYQPAAGAPDDRLVAAGTGYELAGKLKPTVLLIQVASVWCNPCNDEARNVLPVKHEEYAACGGEFFLNLADGPKPGISALPQDLYNWTKLYAVNFPAAIDPEYRLGQLFAEDVYPQNMIIDTTTMKILAIYPGEVVPGTCGNYSVCAVDTDCQACTSGTCGDGTVCATATDCQAKTCTQLPFWTTYESHLDKTRAGCTVK
jgi:hypothetical protein